MKYMIIFTHTRGEWADRVPRWHQLSASEKEQIAGHVRDFSRTLEVEQGTSMVFFDAPTHARTLHMDRDGTVDIRDGTLVDGDEFVAGYFIIEANSMDEAVEWARRGRWLVGSNEVREIKELKI